MTTPQTPIVYKNPTPVAVGIVPVRLKTGALGVLGVIRAIGKLGPALPGGFVDEMESIEVAVARELFEETGFVSDASQWKLSHSNIATGRNNVLIFAHYTGAPITEDDVNNLKYQESECSGLVIFETGAQLVFDLHQAAMEQYLATQNA